MFPRHETLPTDFRLKKTTQQKGMIMKASIEIHEELRKRILGLSGVTEKQNAGIHEDAFFVGSTMFVHIHGRGHCDIRLSKADQQRALAESTARPHRWAPEAGYVTSIVKNEDDLEGTMRLIRMSHDHFAGRQNIGPTERPHENGVDKNNPPILRLLVIGATGRTGREVVQQALARGHQVTAFVRSPGGVPFKHERLTVVKGNAMDEDELFAAMQNHDAVISTLGPRQVFKPGSLLHDSAIAATHAMQRAGIKRLVVLSAAAHFPGIPNRIASFVMRGHMRDSLAMEETVQSNGLDWTIARPPRLTQENSSGYRSREGAAPKMGFTLSRKAVAAFMLDAIEQNKHLHKIVGIAK
jgi:putative NADH-flavin reductase